jgi:hypothetical protein
MRDVRATGTVFCVPGHCAVVRAIVLCGQNWLGGTCRPAVRNYFDQCWTCPKTSGCYHSLGVNGTCMQSPNAPCRAQATLLSFAVQLSITSVLSMFS